MSDAIELYDNNCDATTNYQMNTICTVDTTNPVGQKVVFNALSDATPLAQHMNEELYIRDIIVEPGYRRSRYDGSTMPCMNTYLIDMDGNAYFTQSEGVYKSVINLLRIYRNGIHDDANGGYLTMKCIETTLANGNTLKKLVLV